MGLGAGRLGSREELYIGARGASRSAGMLLPSPGVAALDDAPECVI